MGKKNLPVSSYHQSRENQLSCFQQEFLKLLQNNMLGIKIKNLPFPSQQKKWRRRTENTSTLE